MKKFVAICVIALFVGVIYTGSSCSLSNDFIVEATDLEINNSGGYIIDIDGVTILHVKGSYYEMGFQHGSLLKEECMQLLRAVIHRAEEQGITYEDLLDAWEYYKNFTPQNHIDELQGFADGLGMPFEYVVAGYLGHYIAPYKSRFLSIECCNFAAWGPATTDGKLYHGRSYDLPIWIKDEESGVYVVQENQIVIIREPDDGYASIFIGLAGYLGNLGGFNEHGLVIGTNGVDSNDETRNGTFVADLMKLILDHSSTAQEAIDHLIGNKTYGRAFIISDPKIQASFAVEISASHSYVGTWDDPVESLYPFWKINNVIRRVNLYNNKTLASTQREKYNTESFVSFLFGKNEYFPMWRHYRALSIGIEQYWGNINSDSMMKILRNTYNGRTDFLFFIASKLHLLEVWHQWIACPETGDMWFTLAGDKKSSFENKVHHVNLFDFIN
jgi:hypothetical protein